jgi:uncharacterized protein (DUF362 family)
MGSGTFKRREFLKLLGCAPLLCALPLNGGCKPRPGTTSSVSLVKNADEAFAIARAVELAGGFGFLSQGESVLIKVALNSPNPFPATTSPFMVSRIVSLLKEHGAGEVFVGDQSPSWQDTRQCLEQTGIYQAVLEAGAVPVIFQDGELMHVQPPGAAHWPRGFSVPALFDQVDHIIVLPTLRTHSMAGFTMGMKIFVGALPQDDRSVMHSSVNFHKAIAEIALCTEKIRLSVLDARQGFNTGGPDSGNLIAPGIVLASTDLAAADTVGLALLQASGAAGASVWNHPTIRRGVEAHSPSLSPETLKLIAEGVDIIDDIKARLRV